MREWISQRVTGVSGFCLMQGPEHGAERVLEIVFIQCDEDIHKTGFSFILEITAMQHFKAEKGEPSSSILEMFF